MSLDKESDPDDVWLWRIKKWAMIFLSAFSFAGGVYLVLKRGWSDMPAAMLAGGAMSAAGALLSAVREARAIESLKKAGNSN